MSRFTVEARAARWQRRFAARRFWGLPSMPATSRPIDFVRLDVALHDVQREFWRAVGPLLARLSRRLQGL